MARPPHSLLYRLAAALALLLALDDNGSAAATAAAPEDSGQFAVDGPAGAAGVAAAAVEAGQCAATAAPRVKGAALIQMGTTAGTLPGDQSEPKPEDAKDAFHLRPGSRIGVLLGHDSRGIVPGSYGAVGVRLARRWAELHNYTLFLEPNLGSLDGARESPVWDKIAAVRRYLPKVDVLFWLDLDVLIVDPSRPAEDLLRRERASCAVTGQADSDARMAMRSDELFLWAATAEFAHFDRETWHHERPAYRLNLCAGAFALRNDPRSFEFLDHVWGERHNPNWPAEQGAMWNVLLRHPEMLSRTCVLPESVFVYESLERPQAALAKRPFAIHATGYKGSDAEYKRNVLSRAACDHVFAASGGCPEPVLLQA